ncbi:MAG: nitronate monooxygenase [Prolixibacteraceae bacterium]|nr:nitronate monooxygenase [Prolixibacteraceae bacterium]
MNPICDLYGIKYPIVQGGMVWCSGWKLASAVSNSGGLGLIGAGSMHPEILREHIGKTKKATKKPFGVNVPLLYPEVEKLMEVIIEEGVQIVFTSAGNPEKWTAILKSHNIIVTHVVSSSYFAVKSEFAGVDAIVAEGFEAGGHNGREETTTMSLIPSVRTCVKIPILAAGGIASGKSMFAAMALGADGAQVGTRFVLSEESSAHPAFKNLVSELSEGGTKLSLKKLAPVRLIKNKFFETINQAEAEGKSAEELKTILGRGRAKIGMFEGDLEEGELEIGQVSANINTILPVSEIINEIISEYNVLKNEVQQSGRFIF